MPESPIHDPRRSFLRRAGYALRIWRRAVDSHLRPFQLTDASWVPLLHIARSAVPLRHKELADMVGIESSTLVRVIDALDEAGLVERRPDAGDRRAKTIHLTSHGRRQADKVEAIVLALRERLLDGLSDEDLAAAYRVVDHICAAIEDGRLESGNEGAP